MENEERVTENCPGVSVIVCARNESDNLRHYLHALCGQKYPNFEVIVVNDGSEDDTQTVLEQYTQLFRNLRITFVPKPSSVFPTFRHSALPLSLAAKAAKYDYLLLTEADCRPETPEWISSMMQGFAEEDTEVVMGRAAFFSDASLPLRLRIAYGITNLHPFKFSNASNYAIRKDVLFRMLTSQERKVKRKKVRTPEAIVWKRPFTSFRDWRNYRMQNEPLIK